MNSPRPHNVHTLFPQPPTDASTNRVALIVAVIATLVGGGSATLSYLQWRSAETGQLVRFITENKAQAGQITALKTELDAERTKRMAAEDIANQTREVLAKTIPAGLPTPLPFRIDLPTGGFITCRPGKELTNHLVVVDQKGFRPLTESLNIPFGDKEIAIRGYWSPYGQWGTTARIGWRLRKDFELAEVYGNLNQLNNHHGCVTK